MDSSAKRTNSGVLTMAIGPRYRRMARRLAWSLDVHAPGLGRAVITDVPTKGLSRCFEHVIEFEPGASGVFGQKVRLDGYSPFAETLFIDADSLVVGNLDDVWKLMQQVPFAVIGHQSASGRWYGDVAQMAAAVGANSLPLFNGGLYYFNRSAASRRVFATARELMNRYEELGLADHLIGHAEEPVIAMALAKHGIEALDDGGTAMRTPIGLRGDLQIDVLRGYCRFNKEGEFLLASSQSRGECVTPRIMHFAGSWTQGFRYRRETLKLTLHRLLPFVPASVISQTVNGATNVPYEVSASLTRPLRPWVRRLRQAGVFG